MPETINDHVCGKPVMQSTAFKEKWNETIKELKNFEALEAFLREHNQVSCQQVLHSTFHAIFVKKS